MRTRLLAVLSVLAALWWPCGVVAAPGDQAGAIGAGAPAAAVRAAVSRASVKTSERVVLTIEADVPSGWRLDPLSLEGSLPEGWNVLRTGTPRTTPIPGGERSTQTFELEPFLPGKAEVRPLKVTLRPVPRSERVGGASDPPGKSAAPALDAAPITLETGPLTVEVLSVLPEGEAAHELSEIKGVVDPVTPTNWWMVAGIAVGVCAAGALAWALVARIARKSASRVVTRPAHEIALERLERLLNRGLLTPGRERFKEFFDGASAVLREYIEDRFALRAPERTTEEFLRDARASSALSQNDVEALGRFLAECDMVKFARATPGAEDAERAAGIVREFIVKTRTPEATVVVSGPGAAHGPRLAAALADDAPAQQSRQGVSA